MSFDAPNNGLFDNLPEHHFFNKLPEKIQGFIRQLPAEWFDMSEPKFLDKVLKGLPDEKDYDLRINFWEEYHRAFNSGTRMNMTTICDGIMQPPSFYKLCERSPERLFFIITEPKYLKDRQEKYLHMYLHRIHQIAELQPQINPKTGNMDLSVYHLQVKVYESLDNRVQGAAIQKNVNVNLNSNQSGKPKTAQERIKELQSQRNQIEAPKTILPVEAVVKEAGRVQDAEFTRVDDRRDESHKK